MNMSPGTFSWVSLVFAIIFGVFGTIALKKSHCLQKIRPTVFLIIFYTISFIALTFAIQHLELSMVYAVWSGVGTLLVAIVGFLHFNEKISAKKIIFLTLIIVGVIGIHLSDHFS